MIFNDTPAATIFGPHTATFEVVRQGRMVDPVYCFHVACCVFTCMVTVLTRVRHEQHHECRPKHLHPVDADVVALDAGEAAVHLAEYAGAATTHHALLYHQHVLRHAALPNADEEAQLAELQLVPQQRAQDQQQQ